MKQVIIIGGGGTTSYALPHLIRFYNTQTEERDVLILDRDIIEERNLLRQAFLTPELNMFKGQALIERLHPLTKPHVNLRFTPQYVNSVQDLIQHVSPTVQHLTLICGADNNMARLRIHIAAYILQDRGITVEMIDSGNAEFHGQVLLSRLVSGHSTFLTGIADTLESTKEDWLQFTIKEQAPIHRITSVFTPNDAWRDRLTRGEHELGCQDNVVINPQNIGANMTAGVLILQAQYLLIAEDLNVGMLKFDTKSNNVEVISTPPIEDGYTTRIVDILSYLQTDEGIEAIFGTIPIEQMEQQETVVTPTETEQATVAIPTVKRAKPTTRRTPPRRLAKTISLLDELDVFAETIAPPTSLDEIEEILEGL